MRSAVADPKVSSTGDVANSDVGPGSDAPTESHRGRASRPTNFPQPGQDFLGFEVVSELGSGSMGRVFLARQRAMASRTVVLKVGHHLSSECEKLAKLQHPNVVPVYSFHTGGDLQVVCMPYRGPLTLAHLIARLKRENLETLSGRALTTVLDECRRGREPADATDVTAVESPAAAPAPVWSDRLLPGVRRLTYIDAVLTIIRQVTEGLRFAHAERIVHADLKPANVLIADDGSAQLIDFGISFDKSNQAADHHIGGTRPYMSPEQMSSFVHQRAEYDERSDLYAVGVLLYELVTGRLPYDTQYEGTAAAVEADRAKRFAPPLPARALNPCVSRAVEAIIAKCLAPDLADRYQTAGELLEDVGRQIARRPLRFAANTSPRELVSKWFSRHRRLAVALGVVAAFGVTVYGFARHDAKRLQEAARLSVTAAAEPFAADLREAEFLFGMSAADPAYRDQAWACGKRALERFGAWDDEKWFQRDEFQTLPEDRLTSYRQQAASMLLLLANSRAEQAGRTEAGPAKTDLLRQAADWNRRAAATHPGPDGCRAVWVQQGYLARLNGNPAEAERLAHRADGLPSNSFDRVLEGRQLLAEGRVQAAIQTLATATKSDPRNFWAKYYAAVGHQMLGHEHEAAAGYDICESLMPDFFGTYFNRGQSRLRLGRPAEAEADFDRAIHERPSWGEAHFQRALAREIQKHYPEAIADLNRSLELGYTPTSVLLVRSRVYGRLNDQPAADRDFAEGIRTVPTDERGWLARARARIFRDPPAALTDYAEALRLNPRLLPALQGQAHLLGQANKNAEAVQVLTKMIDINPDAADAWSGRGVMRARLDDRDGAIADGREALRLSDRPATRYQVAGIYAMTSRTHPDDRREAFSLLDAALRDGFGFEYLPDDLELNPIRKDPAFQKLIDAARLYRESLKRAD